MILYFTGTGNSRYVAQRIAERMGDEAHCINDKIREKDTRPMKGDGSLIVVAPTYAWRLPRIVVEWLIKNAVPRYERSLVCDGLRRRNRCGGEI